MQAVEDDYSDSPLGTYTWYVAQPLASVMCEGCTRGYKWMCPYAYVHRAYQPKPVLPKLTKTF